MALFVWLAAVHREHGRLIGALAVFWTLVAGLVCYGRYERRAGAYGIRDSLLTAHAIALTNLRDSLMRQADSSARVVVETTTVVETRYRNYVARRDSTPRIEAIHWDTSQVDSMVPVRMFAQVYVASDSQAYLVERRAAILWQWTDSMLWKVADPLIRGQEKTIRAWSETWANEREARQASDSLASAWRQQAALLKARGRNGNKAVRYLRLAAFGFAAYQLGRMAR